MDGIDQALDSFLLRTEVASQRYAGHHVFFLYVKDLLDRAGSRLYGFHHLPAQVATIYHEAARGLERVHPVCETPD